MLIAQSCLDRCSSVATKILEKHSCKAGGRVSIEKYKAEVMSEEFRQTVLQHTSTQAMNYDETKKPNYQPPQESFRKLNVD